MSELVVLRGLLFAAECFLASAVLPVLGFAVTALMRRRAALRHLAWTTMFGVLAVLPMVAVALPPRLIVQRVAAPVAGLAPVTEPVMAPAALVPAAPPPAELFTAGNIVLLLAGLWLAGLAWQALRLALGGLGLMRLRSAGAPFASEIATRSTVLLSRGEDGPSTFGILRPVVLLPRSAQGWPAARLEAVLRHEAAHVRRRDTLSQFAARLVCALYWFNPLLWLAARALRRDAEIAADDEVLAGGMTPSAYAAELVGLAADARGVAPPIPLGIAMAGPPLSERVRSVLSENSSRKGVNRMDIAKTVGLGLAAALLLGTARFDLAVAQDAPAAPPAPRAPVAPPAPPAPRVNVERRVTVERQVDTQVNTEVQRAIEAQAAAVKAQADLMVTQARARAAAETDPKTKEIFRREAEERAAQAAVTKADADLALAHAREAARRAADVRVRVTADAARARDVEQRMAQARERAGADRERARVMVDRIQAGADKVDYRVRFEGGPVVVATGPLNAAMAEAMQKPEVRRAIDEAVRTAMADARKAINDAIAKATGLSGAALMPGRDTFSYDLVVPDSPFPAPPAPPALNMPPAPPVPAAPPAPPRPLN